jgi:error-prone DNA polymerase
VPFAELCCQSSFSFLIGVSSPQDLVHTAKAQGYAALALTDECSLAGVVRAHEAAKAAGIKLIVGSLLRTDDGLDFVLLAMDREGYAELSALITTARGRAVKGQYRLSRADMAHGPTRCLCLWLPGTHVDADALAFLARHFPGRLGIAVLQTLAADDAERLATLTQLGERHALPCIASNAALMHVRTRKPLADVLTAIRSQRCVADCGHDLLPNGERHLRPIATLRRLYPEAMLAASVAFAERCTFSLDCLRYEYPEELVPPGETPSSYLRALTLAGLATRYPTTDADTLRARAKCLATVERELALIAELRYEAFFLTVHDIVREARRLNILCQGRGSAANSAVCYCLGITEVDPGRAEVLFERFISRERGEPPDIDVDFEHQRREEIIQYIYAKYGRQRAALAATVICYRRRSAVRDVGRALGIEATLIDALSRSLAWWDDDAQMTTRLREAGFDPESRVTRQYLALVRQLLGMPRHLSQHVGGFVIARDAISRLVPVENAAMPGRSVIQWDKDDLEALGLLKVDVLALGMLTAIRLTLDLLQRYYGMRMTMADVPREDPATYAMISRADTVGVFQIESRAQMSMLPRLKPNCFYDLVIEVAIVRPGPIQGGMVHPYLRRRQGLEPIHYPSAAVEAVLKRTLGVSIFQEQVMKLAEVAAGFTPGEADQLRRAMAAWKRKGGLEPFRDKLMQGMLARGYTRDYAEQLYRQIQGFGEYGFPESHAASFALLAYVSAWLKCHHPAAFACGLLNAWPMGFYTPSQIIQDLRRHGVEVRPIDVQHSDTGCTLERGEAGKPALRLGLRLVRSLSEAGASRLVAARVNGPFISIEEVINRAQLHAGDRNALAAADAFRSLAEHRRSAFWHVLGVDQGMPLAPAATGDALAAALDPPGEGESVILDHRHTGLSLRSHPMALLRPRLAGRATAADLARTRTGRRVKASGLVTCRQRPGTASGVVFVTLEDETGNVNVVIWSSLVERQRRELLASLMTVIGKVESHGEVVHLIAERLIDDSHLLGELAVVSRDFH